MEDETDLEAVKAAAVNEFLRLLSLGYTVPVAFERALNSGSAVRGESGLLRVEWPTGLELSVSHINTTQEVLHG